MLSVWTKHLEKDPQSKERFEQYVKGSKELLNRLETILDEELSKVDDSELTAKQFDTPNWPYLQAYKNGGKAALNKIKTLISIKD